MIFLLPLPEKVKSPIKIRLHKAYSIDSCFVDGGNKSQMTKFPREHTLGGPVNSVKMLFMSTKLLVLSEELYSYVTTDDRKFGLLR